MANPEKFKIGDELYRTAFGSVNTAVLADDSAQADQSQSFAIKIYDPAGYESNTEGAANFLKSVEAQQQASAAGKNWAPIHDSGRNEESKSFYVTNYYPRSAQRLINGRVSLTADALHEIVRAIMSGLLEMKQVGGRSHGNIKPSNVLIGGRGAVSDAKIVLTDPAPGPCADANAEAEDLRAVGALIYHLIMHRAFHTTSWPLADGEQWKHLGRGNRAWRDFCSTLLHPDPRARPSLVDANRVVKSLAVRKLVTRGRLKVAAAAVVVGVLLGGAGWGVLLWENNVKGDVRDIRTQWLKPLDGRTELASDPCYADLVKNDKAACDESIDAFLADDVSLRPSAIQNFWKARSAAPACKKAWIDAVTVDRLDVSSKLKVLGENGWTVPAVPPSPDPTSALEVTNCVDHLIKLRTRLSAADPNNPARDWQVFQAKLQPLQSPGFYHGFALYLENEVAHKIVLSNESWNVEKGLFAKYGGMADQLRKTKERPIDLDFERIKRDNKQYDFDKPSYAEFAWFAATPDSDPKYSNADIYKKDPDLGKDEAKRLRERLTTEIDDGIKAHPEAIKPPNYASKRAGIESAINTLEKGPYVKKDIDDGVIPKQSELIAGNIDNLAKECGIEKPTVDLTGFIVQSIDPIDLNNLDLRTIKSQQAAELKNAKKLFTRSGADKREKELQAWVAALKQLDTFNKVARNLSGPYKTAADDRGEKVWKDLLERMNKPPGSKECLSASDAKAESDNFEKWCTTAAQLAEALLPFKENQIIDVSGFRAFDAGWLSSTDVDRTNFWKSQVIAAGPIHNAMLPLLPRLDNLHATIAKDPAKLEDAVALKLDPVSLANAEIFLAEWDCLGGVKRFAAPLGIEGLSKEAGIRHNLAAVKAVVDGDPLLGSAALKADLAKALDPGPARWCDAFKSAGSAATLDALMNVYGDFGVTEAMLTAPTTPATTASYNACLWLTKQSLDKNDPALKTRIDALAAAAVALPDPYKLYGHAMTDWLKKGNPDSASLKDVFDPSLYCLANHSPDLFTRVRTVAEGLRANDPKQALALSKSFLTGEFPFQTIRDNSIERAAWVKHLVALADLFPTDLVAKKDSLTEAVRLGDPTATGLLISLDPAAITVKLLPRETRKTFDAKVLLDLAGRFKDESLAFDWYELAAEKGDAKATEWIAGHTQPINQGATARLDGGVDLTWGWPNAEARQFRVYRGIAPDGPFTDKDLVTKLPINEKSCTDPSPFAGKTNYYKIVAVSNGVNGTGVISPGVNPYPPAPAEPTATADPAGGIKVTWKAVTDSSLLNGYSISRATTPTGTLKPLPSSPFPATRTSITDPDAPIGELSYYKITAVDKLHDADHLGNGADTTKVAPKPPAIGDLKAKVVDGAITLTWTRAVDQKLTNYYVYRDASPVPLQKLLESQNTWKDDTAEAGKTYNYKVRAVDSVGGEGLDPPTPTSVVVPPTPVDPRATYSAAVYTPTAVVTVNWNIKANDPKPKSYRISRSGGTPLDKSVDGAPFTDDSVLPDTHYVYEIRAVSDIDQGKAAMAPVYVPAKPTQPIHGPDPEHQPATLLAPGNPTASGDDDGIHLTWEPVPGATSYTITRTTNGIETKLDPSLIKSDPHLVRYWDKAAPIAKTSTYKIFPVRLEHQGDVPATTGATRPKNGQ